jgi:hypothetical protein
MSVYLPATVRKDPVFSRVLDAASTWKLDDSCLFRQEHRRKLEKGDYGSNLCLVKSLYYGVEYCALCGQMFSQDNVCILEAAAQYLIHLGFLKGYYLMKVHNYLAILREERTFKKTSQRVQ